MLRLIRPRRRWSNPTRKIFLALRPCVLIGIWEGFVLFGFLYFREKEFDCFLEVLGQDALPGGVLGVFLGWRWWGHEDGVFGSKQCDRIIGAGVK
jgi:hypothetical protein